MARVRGAGGGVREAATEHPVGEGPERLKQAGDLPGPCPRAPKLTGWLQHLRSCCTSMASFFQLWLAASYCRQCSGSTISVQGCSHVGPLLQDWLAVLEDWPSVLQDWVPLLQDWRAVLGNWLSLPQDWSTPAGLGPTPFPGPAGLG